MPKKEPIDFNNPEGYPDPTPFAAITSIEGAETKAYHLYETVEHMARLAGFRIDGTIMFIDRSGRVHDGANLRRRKLKALKEKV